MRMNKFILWFEVFYYYLFILFFFACLVACKDIELDTNWSGVTFNTVSFSEISSAALG